MGKFTRLRIRDIEVLDLVKNIIYNHPILTDIENIMKPWEYRLIPLWERITLNTVIDDVTGCHNYIGNRDSGGYGQTRDGGKKRLVHRIVWMKNNGEITNKEHVLHHCDNPSCINIDHLFIGDNAMNVADKVEKGRCGYRPTGALHKRPMAKLTDKQVYEIKVLLSRGYRQCDIAKDFKVSRNIICDISKGNTWNHISIQGL